MESEWMGLPDRELTVAVDRALGDGQLVPCLAEREPLWLSERRVERKRAAELCRQCPVIAECAALAESLPAEYGVWAGVDYAPSAGRQACHQSLPSGESRRLRRLVEAAHDSTHMSRERRARDRELWRLYELGWSMPALAEAAGVKTGVVAGAVQSERRHAGLTAMPRRADHGTARREAS